MVDSSINSKDYSFQFPIIKVVDMGCGDGAIGEAMMKKGFRDIVGVDISQSMLNIAESKGCYNSIKKADLLKPLPFNDSQFDVLVTAGVTTYLGLFWTVI